MQIPLWLFLTSLLAALTLHDMASSLLRRTGATSVLNHIKSSLSPSISRYIIPSFQQVQVQVPSHHFSTSTPPSTTPMSSSAPFLEAIKNRRTFYALKKESTIPDAKIQEIINHVILHTPSSFNSQSTRVVLLVKEEHTKLWEITKEILKSIVPAENYPATEQRLNGFQAGYGTILFFESTSAVQAMKDKFPLYADKFPLWATQSDAMHQFALWTALEAEGLGCNLQHYSPLIDERVAKEWGVDKDWVLNAQLVFGTPAGEAGGKTFLDVGERFKVFGA